jgi:hypothetical protein
MKTLSAVFMWMFLKKESLPGQPHSGGCHEQTATEPAVPGGGGVAHGLI